MKTYKLQDPEKKGLLRISLVEDPAIQSTLMAFSNEEDKPMQFVDEEQQIIYAPALIPNKLIFRKNIKGEPAQVFFDSETIKQLHIDGSRNGYDSNINLNHEDKNTDGIFCFESWLIENNPQDKAYSMGFDVPVGTLMKGYKIDNKETWESVKNGKLTGLSIEAYLDHSEVRLSKNQTTDGKDIWFENAMFTKGDTFRHLNGDVFNDGSYELMTNVIVDIENGVVSDIREVTLKKENMNKKGFFAMAFEAFKAAWKFAEMTDYGSGYFGSSLEIGSIIADKDGNPMPNVEFTFEGNKYKTDDAGAISEVEPVEEGGGTDEKDARILELETENADLKAKISELEATKMANEESEVKLKSDFETLKSEKEQLLADLIEAKKVQSFNKQEDIPYEKMTNAQKVKYNRERM